MYFSPATYLTLLLSLSASLITTAPTDSSENINQALESRATKHCANQGKISRDKHQPECLPANSQSWRSAYNCKNLGGCTYLCVQGGVATCWPISGAIKSGFESGECFT